ncbi:MAG: pyridoxal-phosphate dependent enzyme [Myxococcota bacterium]|nr:pyridoxal-phosphate dependent enzyme [Myxococcota bacterium]
MAKRNVVDDAHNLILRWIRVTPIMRMQGPGARPVVLKFESFQRSGSFKIRGALNKVMGLGDVARAGVVTASGGNHGLGVAWAGWLAGIPAHVFIPATTPSFKVRMLERANAQVTRAGASYAEAEMAALAFAETNQLAYIHAYDDNDVIAGQGTVVRELLSQAPEIGTIVVAVGGGGLAAGAGLAAEGRRVVGVEPFGAATMHAAFTAGRPVKLSAVDSIASDSLGAWKAGQRTFELCKQSVDRIELVHDDSLITAQNWLWEQARIVCELGAAAGLAALANGSLDDDPAPIGIIICGGNVDPKKFVR